MPKPSKAFLNAPRIYWDSCVMLSLIEGDPTRAHAIDSVMQEAKSETIRLFTSTFSVCEVAFASHERGGALDPTTEQRIDGLWTPGPITLVEMHLLIGQNARTLMRKALAAIGPGLKGKDAIHIATASYIGATAMHTYEPKLHRYSALAGLPIGYPEPITPTLNFPQGDQPEEP